jgi:hypothetical protein
MHYLIISFFWLGCINPTQQKSTMQMNINSDEAAVIAKVRELAEFMIARDTIAMNNILDEHYTLTHMTGYVQPKAEWFDEVTRESMKYYSAKEVSMNVKLNGNSADVVVRNLVDARIWGSRNTWRLQQKMKLEKRKGLWIILSSVASTF